MRQMVPAALENLQAGTVAGARGTYGFCIEGLDDAGAALLPVPADWPTLRLVRNVRPDAPPGPAAGTVDVDSESARVWIGSNGRIDVDRASMTVSFSTKRALTPDEVLHPFLGLPASFASHWLGRQVLHGGAFVLHGRAWAVLGDKEAGKSSTLGYLMRRGLSVLSDDILALDGRAVFAGPRCIDLRGQAAAVLGGERLGEVGSRERWRLRPGAVAASVPLAGLVVLEWAQRESIEPLDAGGRLRALIAQSVVRPDDAAALPLLDLAGLPAWRVRRPRDLNRAEDTISRLLGCLA